MKVIAAAILLILIATPYILTAQSKENFAAYNYYKNKAYEAQHDKQIDSAIYYFSLANRQGLSPKFDIDIGNLLIKKGAYKEALGYIEKDITNGDLQDSAKFYFDSYESIKAKPEIIAFAKRCLELVRSAKLTYKKKYSVAFGSLIYEMFGRDQAVRANVFWSSPSQYDTTTILAVVSYLDTAVNLPMVLSYLNAKGFPTYEEIAYNPDVKQNFESIIHHLLQYSGPKRDELEQLIVEAMYKGRYSPYAYVAAMDYDHMHKTGKQLYGTYMAQGQDGLWHFEPQIDSIETVDMRRGQWGLMKLNEISYRDWRSPEMPAGYVAR